MVINFIMSSTFEEVDIDENLCIVPPCRHILMLESMDGYIGMSDFYIIDAEGSIMGLKNSAELFFASRMKSCPTCRGPLRTLNWYSRIVRRALINEATKKFIIWANMKFILLVARIQGIKENLRESTRSTQRETRGVLPEAPSSGPLQLRGTRDKQISQITKFTQKDDRYKPILALRRDIKKFLELVDEGE